MAMFTCLAPFSKTNLSPTGLMDRSLAFSAVNAVCITTGLDWEVVFNALLHHALTLSLMPNDMACVKALLASFGFFPQPGRLAGKTVGKTCASLGDFLPQQAVGVVHTRLRGFLGGTMTALLPGKTAYQPSGLADTSEQEVLCVWLRWPDLQDHSPVPRRKRRSTKSYRWEGEPARDHKAFHYYQANPAENNIGDCVVRGIAAVLDIPWGEALARLASYGAATVNVAKIYERLLADEGFLEHKSLRDDGILLTGAEFCDAMDHRYHDGERIFIHCGPHHVAAVLPIRNEKGVLHYRIVDSWDSSERRIGSYWVQRRNRRLSDLDDEDNITGKRLEHPVFGSGVILGFSGPCACPMLRVRFERAGIKLLGRQWAFEHCHIGTGRP